MVSPTGLGLDCGSSACSPKIRTSVATSRDAPHVSMRAVMWPRHGCCMGLRRADGDASASAKTGGGFLPGPPLVPLRSLRASSTPHVHSEGRLSKAPQWRVRCPVCRREYVTTCWRRSLERTTCCGKCRPHGAPEVRPIRGGSSACAACYASAYPLTRALRRRVDKKDAAPEPWKTGAAEEYRQ